MKKLIICETPFQIIMALYIKKLYSNANDEVDIIIGNTFNNYRLISDRIKKTSIFQSIYNADIKIFFERNKKKKLLSILKVLNLKKMMKEVFGENIKQYDEMYCWNYDPFTISVRSYFSFYQKKIKIFIFEEGYISYFPFDEVVHKQVATRIIEIRNKLFGISNITRDSIDGLLLFEPDLLLYNPKCQVYKMDRKVGLTDSFKRNIDNIFAASEVSLKYNKKYIIFEENHPEYNDEPIFDNIINKVGRENVIIKLHPLRKENRFEKKGVMTLGNDGVPWEAIAYFLDFSDKVLISIGSGSISSCRMLFGKKMNAFLIYKFMDTNLKQFDSKFCSFWNKLESKKMEGGIYMPRDEQEFYNMLDEIIERSR